jgi:hypothetical protein
MTPDDKARESKLWKRAVKAHAKLAAAQSKGDGPGATKAWQELSALIEGNAPPEESEEVEVPLMSVARRELHQAFPDLAKIP